MLQTIINEFPQPKQLRPSPSIPKIKLNGVAKITSLILDNGLVVKINNKSLRLRYPPGIWGRFPKVHRQILSENIAYSSTFQIPYLYPSLRRLNFGFPVPLSEPFMFKGLALSLPSTAIMQSHKKDRVTSNLLRRLFEIDFVYSSKKTEIPPYNRTSFSDQAVMPFTFGKDSLLTFALARELGLTVHPVYIAEPHYPYEELVKRHLSESFQKEFKTRISMFKNTLGLLRDPAGWLGWELQLTQYSLILLPYVYAKKAGYILFSNEQSCNDTIVDEDGFRCNPVFEQSHSWLLQNSLMTSIVGGNSLSIGTIIEPVHEIAIIKILHKRYPEIGKYQSSCDIPFDKPKEVRRWCENCSKCGRMYMFLLAHGIDPARVGFRHDLLRDKYHHVYALFSENRVKEFGYDQSGAGRDEQILAFLMAYKKGFKGPVMRSFVRKHLAYAKKNERKLREKYFSIYTTKTVPSDIRPRILRIYHQELDSLH